MCGITGVFSLNEDVAPRYIAEMTDLIRHRGPDDEGYLAVWTPGKRVQALSGRDSKVPLPSLSDRQMQANLYLGHRRLSIIDTSSAGHQPMCSSDGKHWLVYNGEIYNFRELRRELLDRGYRFVSNTDTEVLLAGYSCWGTDLPKLLNGMWAFVIYDREKNVLVGSRDYAGVKPIYYVHEGDRFAFASEAKSLICLPWVSRKVNPTAVACYLVEGLDQSAYGGFFEKVRELGPGYQFSLDLTNNKLTQSRYFQLEWTSASPSVSVREARQIVETVRENVISAVERHLMSDVKVGSCLSGGIDSSSIVGVIRALQRQNELVQIGSRQLVLTACYPDSSIDESHWAEKVAREAGAEWIRTYPTAQGMLESLEDLVYTQDFPFASSSIYAQYCVMKLAREHGISVLLDGQGGDELFTGYPPYYTVYWAELLKQGHWRDIRRELRFLSTADTTVSQLVGSLVKYAGSRCLPSIRRSMVQKQFRHFPWISTELHGHLQQPITEGAPFGNLNAELAHLFQGGNLQSLLRYEDRNSMRFS
nr:asparagine synthase (glutamine-hydrolyzing) [Candidatus Ozemobacteraceae bacterium]